MSSTKTVMILRNGSIRDVPPMWFKTEGKPDELLPYTFERDDTLDTKHPAYYCNNKQSARYMLLTRGDDEEFMGDIRFKRNYRNEAVYSPMTMREYLKDILCS